MELDLDTVQTNMIRGNFSPIWSDGKDLSDFLARKGILVWIAPDGSCRLVTHYWINSEDIEKFLSALREYAHR